MAKFDGTVLVTGLPPHRGMILSVRFYRVADGRAPPPFGGDPPADEATDCHEVYDLVHLETKSSRP